MQSIASARALAKHPDPACRGMAGIDRKGTGEAGISRGATNVNVGKARPCYAGLGRAGRGKAMFSHNER